MFCIFQDTFHKQFLSFSSSFLKHIIISGQRDGKVFFFSFPPQQCISSTSLTMWWTLAPAQPRVTICCRSRRPSCSSNRRWNTHRCLFHRYALKFQLLSCKVMYCNSSRYRSASQYAWLSQIKSCAKGIGFVFTVHIFQCNLSCCPCFKLKLIWRQHIRISSVDLLPPEFLFSFSEHVTTCLPVK